MSFLDNFGQWNKLDTKNQRSNPTKMKYPTITCKITKQKKDYLCIHLFYQSTGNCCF